MGAGEPEKRAGAERIELEGAFETLRGLVVVAAVLQRRTDSDVRGGQVGVQFNRTGGVLARQPYPLRVWRRGVLCEIRERELCVRRCVCRVADNGALQNIDSPISVAAAIVSAHEVRRLQRESRRRRIGDGRTGFETLEYPLPRHHSVRDEPDRDQPSNDTPAW